MLFFSFVLWMVVVVEEKRMKATEKKELFHFVVMFAFKKKRLTQNIHSHTHTHNSSHSSWSYQLENAWRWTREKRNDISNKKSVHTHIRWYKQSWSEIRSSKTVITFIRWKNLQFRGDTLHTVVFCFIFDYDGGSDNEVDVVVVVVVDDNKNVAKQTHTVYFNLSRWQTKNIEGFFFPFSNMDDIHFVSFFRCGVVWVRTL